MLNVINKDIEPYIDERISSNMNMFKESEKWKTLHDKFYYLYELILSKKEDNSKEDLEKLYSIFNDLRAEEQYVAYKIGFVDGVRLKEEIRI